MFPGSEYNGIHLQFHVTVTYFIQISTLQHITHWEPAHCHAELSRGVSLQITNLRVAPDARTRLAYVRDLPCEVPDEPVKVFLCGYGVVHSLTPQAYPFIPNVLNGTKVTLAKDLPSSVRITGYDGLWYQGQPHVFPVCCLPGHCVKDCPFNGV